MFVSAGRWCAVAHSVARAGRSRVGRSAAERRQGFDLPGGITVTGGALLLVFALVQGPEAGWAAPATLVGFVVIESRTADPPCRCGCSPSAACASAP
ncbi:hypothetical protein ABZV75_16150 [Streptomyces flaveolus]|uniref:hypothetical protein n=1 Tax=Streptomyces flaveolus TaxID=67297 RepID=UPI0033AC1EB9